MINCPNCKTKFSPSYRCCPRCKNHPTPLEDRREYLKQRSHQLAMEGASRSDLRSFLIEEGLSEADADCFLQDSMRIVQSENRSHGCLRLMTGGVMVAFGVLLLGLLVASSMENSPVKLGGGIPGMFLAAGVFMLITGCLAILSGMYSTTTGK